MLYKSTVGSVDIHIDTKRIEENLKRAQNELDVTVLRDMKNYIPAGQQKAMRNHTYIAQPGLIETDVVYAHYQYVGMLRTDEEGRVVVGTRQELLISGLKLQSRNMARNGSIW